MELPPPPYSPTSTSTSTSTSHLQWAAHSSISSASAASVPPDREHMFEKVVTPSDVGKLNRLVIPKQHAERYFPLDPSSDDVKSGLLLNFEEGPTGRPWRFRYSYWNSSQSYVMTRGWSRFVKDKRLDAGDTVSFSRSHGGHRLFIDWRRRPVVALPTAWNFPVTSPTCWTALPPPPQLYFRTTTVGPVLPHHHHAAILESVPVVAHGPKRHVRLFGVNLECAEQREAEQQPQMQWRLMATANLQPARNNYSELLQLMPPPTTTTSASASVEESKR